MSRYKVDITGINTNELEVLSNEEMLRLFKEYKNGNTSLKDKLVTYNLKLVLSILKRFNNKDRYNMDDLFQIGCIGLIKAVDNFDLSFTGTICVELANSTTTYVSRRYVSKIKKISTFESG